MKDCVFALNFHPHPAESDHSALNMESLLKDLATEDHAELTNLLNYCQFLLDDEEMVTPQGNLNVEARDLLHQRMDEVFADGDGEGEVEAL